MNAKITQGKRQLWQWDTGVQLMLFDIGTANEVHFATPDGVIRRDIVNNMCNIPDVVLQRAGTMVCYVFNREPYDGDTRHEFHFDVLPRPKPADYIDPPDEADNLGQLAERVASIIGPGSGGGAPGQTSPESFGAKGDGVTDDAAAIAQALASSHNVVFDGAKTYAVGSAITIPADSIVDFRGATIVPKGNHDVIQVKPGSHISNLIVRCTNVAGWDSSVMVFYAGDKFGAKNPTRISKVKFYNDTSYNDGVENTGNGIYFYTDDFGQTIGGVSVVEAMTSGFRRGVYIKGIDESVDGQGQFSFIGGNNFRGYWSYRDTYGIYIDGRLPNNIIADHFFTDINIQSDYYGGSKHRSGSP